MINNITVHLTTLGNIRTAELVADCMARRLEISLAHNRDLKNRVYDLMTIHESLVRERAINLGGLEVSRLTRMYRRTLRRIHRILREHIKWYDKYIAKEVAA